MAPETNSESKGWFQTLPQILTAAAAVLTALGTLAAALVSLNIKWTTRTARSTPPSAVTTPSFPCSKAATQVENLICQNVTLASLDLTLNDEFNGLINRLSGSSRELLIHEQAEWRRERDACENYNDKIGCVEREYQLRLTALRNYAQQPAAENAANPVAPQQRSAPVPQVALPTSSQGTTAPSFPCDKARSKVEKTICADSELARLDLTLVNAFESSLGRSAAAKKNRLKREQEEWLRQRNNCENSNNITACLSSAYRSRLAAIAGE